MLEGKKIGIITDRQKVDFSFLESVLSKHRANFVVNKVGDGCLEDKCCDHSNKCSVVIFDVSDPSTFLSTIKKRCDDFASIMYLRGSLVDEIERFDWKCLQKFDTLMNSLGNMQSDGEFVEPVKRLYEQEIVQCVCSAMAIHKKRKQDYDSLLRAFTDSYPYVSSYILLCVVDENGKVISTDSNARKLFGSVEGKNVRDLVKGPAPSLPPMVGQTVTLATKDGTSSILKLLNSFQVTNGVTYHLQTWEIVSETQKMQAAISKLRLVNQKIDDLMKDGTHG